MINAPQTPALPRVLRSLRPRVLINPGSTAGPSFAARKKLPKLIMVATENARAPLETTPCPSPCRRWKQTESMLCAQPDTWRR